MNPEPQTPQATSHRAVSEHVLAAMRAGAGLPVLRALDELLAQASHPETSPQDPSEALDAVIGEIDAWLDELEQRASSRLDACDEGPLKAAIEDLIRDLLAPRREGLVEVSRHVVAGEQERAWILLTQELEELHIVRDRLAQAQRTAAHLREVSRLIRDIPDDEEGQQALEELAQKEALAATERDPARWAEHAHDLERRCLDAIRLPTPMAPAAPGATATDEAATNGAKGATGPIGGNGQDGNEAASPTTESFQASKPLDLTPAPKPWTRPIQPPKRTPNDHAAGTDVLDGWENGDHVDDGLRHGPFWAPISSGEVTCSTDSNEALIAYAGEVEIDLVDIELPRVLSVEAGGEPAELRERIANRVDAITKRHPKQPARRTFLDYLLGKLPKRYRETTRGLALIESIAYALCDDEPWTAPDVGYYDTVKRMVERELGRSPAVDLDQLARSLLGADPEARSLIDLAAREIADEHDGVQYHPDGVLVRVLATRENPDELYALREALKQRLGPERAATLMRALITTRGDQG